MLAVFFPLRGLRRIVLPSVASLQSQEAFLDHTNPRNEEKIRRLLRADR